MKACEKVTEIQFLIPDYITSQQLHYEHLNSNKFINN